MSERDGHDPGVPCWVASGDYFPCSPRGRDAAAIVSPHGAPPAPRPAWVTYVQARRPR